MQSAFVALSGDIGTVCSHAHQVLQHAEWWVEVCVAGEADQGRQGLCICTVTLDSCAKGWRLVLGGWEKGGVKNSAAECVCAAGPLINRSNGPWLRAGCGFNRVHNRWQAWCCTQCGL